MAIQKREYELSIWTETLNSDGTKSELKIGVIAAHDMTYDGRATLIKFQTKSNGTHTLTFQMPDKYFDHRCGDFVLNEFRDWVSNEVKVKLHYKNEWFEFFIKSEKMNKKYKSYMRDYSCSDAYIDELARNGYGITFDTELYNNVEEIGTFTEEIIDGTQWEYSPENNTGDFTEFVEERLFRIPVSQFNSLNGYKLKFEIENSKKKIHNIYTGEERNLEMGDDLARIDKYFWDNYKIEGYDVDKGFDLIGESNLVNNIPNDGYIYVPYSQLNFCYITKGENSSSSNSNFIPATEEAESGTIGRVTSYYLSPPTVDPNRLILFMAIPEGSEVHIDESGLIIDKSYSYVMTVKLWNELLSTTQWYIFERYSDAGGTKKKEIENETSTSRFYGNKIVVYDGYLQMINDVEVTNGKRFSISDRSEINISEEIDLYVTVYNNEYKEYTDLYTNEDWKDANIYFRVCSKIDTRQIIPQLARNYIQNGYNFKNTSGWEIMKYNSDINVTSATIEVIGHDYSELDANSTSLQVTKMVVNGSSSISNLNDYNTIVNFGAIGQLKILEKDKVYCVGIKSINNITMTIGEGRIINEGDYELKGSNRIEINFIGNSNRGSFYLIKPTKNIKNPYICLRHTEQEGTIVKSFSFSEVYLFEAYTKGIDFFPTDNSEKLKGYYKYSGRNVVLNDTNGTVVPGTSTTLKYYISNLFSDRDEETASYKNIKRYLIFENDALAGDTYEYKRYFIQQLKLKDNSKAYDTFGHKEYISADNWGKSNDLPLNAAEYTEDDYDIITNYIDLNKCRYYKGNAAAAQCDCSFGGTELLCMYQKYGYCPYLFETEKHCRKTRTLNGSKSNRFNLTQEISKVFEVYPIYYIEHEENGTIKKDDNGKPIKKIFYVTEKGVENEMGFRYEKNLSNISKTTVSDQIVTKLYVEDVDSELSRTGLCSIKTALDNPSKDSFIIDLSYYIAKGMLNKDQVTRDLYGIKGEDNNFAFLKKLGYYNGEYDKLTNKITNLLNKSYTELEANVLVNLTGIETALKELKKIQKQMDKYKGKIKSSDSDYKNDTYTNYVDKYKEQQEILIGLVRDTFYTNNKTDVDNATGVLPVNFLTNHSISDIKEDYYVRHTKSCTTGMLGQYCVEFNQIKEWKKLRAKYLKDINTISELFFKKYEPYLKEGTWSDSNYLTDDAYYHDALEVAAEGAIPKVTYDISVVPLGILNEDYEIGVCDTTFVEDIGMFGVSQVTGLPNRLKVIISELNEDLDVPSNDTIKVQNFTTQFEDLFEQVTASILSLTFNENIYKRASNFTATLNVQTDSLQGTLDANDLTLLNTSEENIKLDAQGQSGSNINNHNNKYKLTGEGLFFSSNGGESWAVGVTPDGINADYIKTGTLDASRIRIVDGQYLYFLWDKGGITAYREPQKTGNTTIFGGDFARFNKYGLSLAEKDLIRLRAGYEYSGVQGQISSEDPIIGNRDIGFYLYDKSGNVIFQTETVDDISARLSLSGEIYANSSMSASQGTTYTYTGKYTIEESGIILYIITSKVTEPVEEEDLVYKERAYVRQSATSTTCEVMEIWIYKNTSNVVKGNDNNYYYVDISDIRPIEMNFNPNESVSGIVNKYSKVSLSNIIINNILYPTLSNIYQAPSGMVYYKNETSVTPPAIDGNIGVYINNTKINGLAVDDDGYSKRLLSCVKKDKNSNNLKNIFSILADGSLYIGGTITTHDTVSDIDNLPNYIKINSNDGIELTKNGSVLLRGIDLELSVNAEIDRLIAIVTNAGVPAHDHEIRNLEGKTKKFTSFTIDKFIKHAGSDEEREMRPNDINLIDSTRYFLVDVLGYRKENDIYKPISGEKYQIDIKQLIKDVVYDVVSNGRTQSTEVNGGSSYYNPDDYSSSALIQMAYEVVTAHYNNMMSSGLYPVGYYSWSRYLTTTIGGKQIKSRCDCSGLIDGIFQRFGDVSADASSWWDTTSYQSSTGHPSNWKIIQLSSINYNTSLLRPGDIIVRSYGTTNAGVYVGSTGHTEFIVSITNGVVKTYSLGSENKLKLSYENNCYLDSLYNYDFILRRDVETSPSAGSININRSVYDSHKGSDDNKTAINFYFNGIIPESFCGAYPTPENYNTDACKGIRCVIDACKREFGAWPFAAISYAKLIRATIIGNGYINSFANNAKTLYDWMKNVTSTHSGWIGDWSMNNGTNGARNCDIATAQAIYKCFRYPNIYGAEFHTGTTNFKNAIIKAINGIPLYNGCVDNVWAASPCFAVLFNTQTDQDEGTSGTPRMGVYLMYRGTSGSMNIFNKNIQ